MHTSDVHIKMILPSMSKNLSVRKVQPFFGP